MRYQILQNRADVLSAKRRATADRLQRLVQSAEELKTDLSSQRRRKLEREALLEREDEKARVASAALAKVMDGIRRFKAGTTADAALARWKRMRGEDEEPTSRW